MRLLCPLLERLQKETIKFHDSQISFDFRVNLHKNRTKGVQKDILTEIRQSNETV